MNAVTHQRPSLQLDDRQRAMLDAMGIRQWTANNLPANTPTSEAEYAQAAIKSIANTLAIQTPSAVAAPQTAARVRVPPTDAMPTTTPASPAAQIVLMQPLPAGIAQMDWPALQAAVSTCRACSLCITRKNTVFGVGAPSADAALAPQADWLIVGEAPGENEDIQGEPFVGQAGKLLDNMLRAVKVNGQSLGRHSNVFIVNVLKCRPPANRNPSAEEVAMCQPYLQRQIELLQPKIILAMGRFAVQALLGSTEPLGKLRGRVHGLPDGTSTAPVVVTYHPAYLLRNLPDKAKAWQDLMLAVKALQATT